MGLKKFPSHGALLLSAAPCYPELQLRQHIVDFRLENTLRASDLMVQLALRVTNGSKIWGLGGHQRLSDDECPVYDGRSSLIPM